MGEINVGLFCCISAVCEGEETAPRKNNKKNGFNVNMTSVVL